MAACRSDRLPPGQKLTEGFPVLDLGVQPEIPLAEWRLKIDGTSSDWADKGANAMDGDLDIAELPKEGQPLNLRLTWPDSESENATNAWPRGVSIGA